jgi:hypothetical protein
MRFAWACVGRRDVHLHIGVDVQANTFWPGLTQWFPTLMGMVN